MKQLQLAIEQMHCNGCVNRVTAALQKQAGVTVSDVKIGQATVAFDEESTNARNIAQALTEAGYPARVAKMG
jgi:copper chaperone CopZ